MTHTDPDESGAPTVQFQITSTTGAYPVWVGAGLLDRLADRVAAVAPAHRYAVISDKTVGDLYGDSLVRRLRAAGLDAFNVDFPVGEGSKNREEWARITDVLLQAGLGRDSAVLALGGGVTGDLAGFVAATFMRGIPLVQIPTTVLAMVDSSMGGKTGVDTAHGKNQVGAFHPPRAVFTDPALALSQSPSGRAEGLVEAVKHGVILDAAYLAQIEDCAEHCLAGDLEALLRVVTGSVAIKARVVSEDEREGGLRSLLNFGHTLGHAIEATTGYAVGHGQAVALGMVLEARLGERMGVTASGTAARLAAAVGRLGLPLRVPGGLDAEAVLASTRSDKKARAGRTRYVLLERPGVAAPGDAWLHPVPDREVLAALREDGDNG